MNYNIYFSPTGGTKRVADILVRNLNGEFCDVDICRDIESMTLHVDDVCLVSVPSFAGKPQQICHHPGSCGRDDPHLRRLPQKAVTDLR